MDKPRNRGKNAHYYRLYPITYVSHVQYCNSTCLTGTSSKKERQGKKPAKMFKKTSQMVPESPGEVLKLG